MDSSEKEMECNDVENQKEYQEFLSTQSRNSQSNKLPSKHVTIDIISAACSKLAEDESMPSEVRYACQHCDKQLVLCKMQFLDECSVPMGRFVLSSKEKAWANFYTAVALDNNTGELDAMLAGGASFLCLGAFAMLLEPSHQDEAVEVEAVSDREKDILSYVGGAVLQKVKQKAYRLKDAGEKGAILKCIEALTSTTCKEGSMTAILDRGGLLKLTTESELMFLDLESAFRQMFKGNVAQMSVHRYFEACQESVSSKLFKSLYRKDIEDKLKDKLLKDVIFIYFKIRAHHKCKTYIDEVLRKSHREKREKALRKRLK